MSDTIYREDAIKAVKSSIADGWGRISPVDACQNIRCLPPAERPQGWTPCSKKMPSQLGEYLVSGKMKHSFEKEYEYFVDVAAYAPDVWQTWNDWYEGQAEYAILAWMPLPKPWKGADDE